MSQDKPSALVAQVRVPARVDFAGGWSDVALFSAAEGGAVLNAAIDRAVRGEARWDQQGLHLTYSIDVPPDSHLGTSGTIDVAWLSLTRRLMGKEPEPIELAEAAYRLEKLLGVAGGKQDSYAAALGGFNLLRFGKEEEPAAVERLAVPEETVRALEEHSLLCFIGAGPSSGSVHEEVWRRYRQHEPAITAGLRRLRDSAFDGRAALMAGDLDALGGVLTLNRETTRGLHPGTVTERMDHFFTAAKRAGAVGAKACGAGGGGGFLYVIAAEGRRDPVAHALQEQGGTLYPFRFLMGTPEL